VGKKIVDDMIVKRRAMGWCVPDHIVDPRVGKVKEPAAEQC
jgi:carbon-monoxide dehydrogenase catalytic subunit